ncbi:hypothetical protein D8W73_03980 [Citrobacter amalonaticus]|nr:hypothetical protein [Citrobacter amalonaticus]
MKKTLSLDEISIRLLYPLSKRKKQQSDWGDFQQFQKKAPVSECRPDKRSVIRQLGRIAVKTPYPDCERTPSGD